MCSCTGCEYTDKFAAPHFIEGQDGAQACAYPKNYGFEMWPRGNPSGRKAATEYSAHVAHGKRWHNGSKGAEFSADELRISAEPRLPAWIAVSGGLPQADAVTRRYLAWGNAEAQKQTPAAKPALARPAALSKAPQHFPAPDRSTGGTGIIIIMPKPDAAKRKPGRPRVLPDGSARVLVILDPVSRQRAEKLGNGNLSAGVRKALQRLRSA